MARTIHSRDGEWTKWITLFSKYPWFAKNMHGHGDYAQTSCSFAVPSFDYQEDRKDLVYWTNKISDEGVKSYWKEKIQTSIGGKPTKILWRTDLEFLSSDTFVKFSCL